MPDEDRSHASLAIGNVRRRSIWSPLHHTDLLRLPSGELSLIHNLCAHPATLPTPNRCPCLPLGLRWSSTDGGAGTHGETVLSHLCGSFHSSSLSIADAARLGEQWMEPATAGGRLSVPDGSAMSRFLPSGRWTPGYRFLLSPAASRLWSLKTLMARSGCPSVLLATSRYLSSLSPFGPHTRFCYSATPLF